MGLVIMKVLGAADGCSYIQFFGNSFKGGETLPVSYITSLLNQGQPLFS